MHFYHDSVQLQMQMLLAFRSVSLFFFIQPSYDVASFDKVLSADIYVNVSAAAAFGLAVVLRYALAFEEYGRDVFYVEDFDDLIECGVEEVVQLLSLDAEHHELKHDFLWWPQFFWQGFDSVSNDDLHSLLCGYAKYGFPVYTFLEKGSVCCFAP